ncbi:hypothetical protein [uncultured Gammaproteobacteria bacterium]|nr:hypothetical protein [uncultured Gammaproteobacteria bacterium]
MSFESIQQQANKHFHFIKPWKGLAVLVRCLLIINKILSPLKLNLSFKKTKV